MRLVTAFTKAILLHPSVSKPVSLEQGEIFYIYAINQQVHVYQYVQSHLLFTNLHDHGQSVLQQEYNHFKIIVQRNMIKPLGVTFEQV